jgi:hypothetical protein
MLAGWLLSRGWGRHIGAGLVAERGVGQTCLY